MKIYTLSLTIEDTLEAENIRKAADEFKSRMEAGFYGPTFKDITEVGTVEEEVT